ncbi:MULTISPECIES: hypothetical protein [unclassified Bradyrhizobium]|nr:MULTISPECIES: hypothetical protein [unclassified Bradyrhizobium]
MAYYANIAVEQVDTYPTSSLNSIRSFADLAARLIAERHSIPITEEMTNKRTDKTKSRFRDTNDIYQDIESRLQPSGRQFFIHVFRHANPNSHGQSGISENINDVRLEANAAVQLAEPFGRWLQANYVYAENPFVDFFETLLGRIKTFAVIAGILFFAWAIFILRSPPANNVVASNNTPAPAPRYAPQPAIPTVSQPATALTQPQAPARIVAPAQITLIKTGRDTAGGGLSDTDINDTYMAPIPTFAALAYFENAIPSQTVLQLTLRQGTNERKCDPLRAPTQRGTFWCRWAPLNLDAGTYEIVASAGDDTEAIKVKIIAWDAGELKRKTADTFPRKPANKDRATASRREPALAVLRTLHLSIAPYIPQHVQFDDADQMVVRNRRGVQILLNGAPISDCSDSVFTATQHGMYSFSVDECGNTRAEVEVVKYVRR